MNKLIVDKDNVVSVNNNVLNIEILVNKLEINASGKVLINDFSSKESENLELIINLAPNSELIYNRFNNVTTMNDRVNLNLSEKSTLIFNSSIVCKGNSTLEFNSNINGNNNNCEVNIKVVTEKNGIMQISATGEVTPNIKNNNFLENIRILMLNAAENVIIPNLLVSSNEVEVNHNATISSVDKNFLFYLTSKGISEENAILLIKKGYLLNNLQIDEKTIDIIDNLL
ncbi:MAG: SufD family Fe-S cluster assembly protein [Bacilli bacterium]